MNKLFIEDLDVRDKRVIVRVDFNVPVKDGRVENDKRLRASLPTIRRLKEQGARLILMSHLGRPKGKVVDSMRMAPVAAALGGLLGCEVKVASDCIGPQVKQAAASLGSGDILLLENLRFHEEEEKNDSEFARQLAGLAEIYINDAFGTAHRAHASTAGITAFVNQAAAGYLMKAELDYLGKALVQPQKPFVAIMGGAKVSSKIAVIEQLLQRVDRLLLGGAMTHTFLKAQGREIGRSVYEEDKVELAAQLLKKGGDRLVLPVDYSVTDDFDFGQRRMGELRTVAADSLPANGFAVDIGPQSITAFAAHIQEAKTVVWNGPVGVFEIEATSRGTFAVAEALAKATAAGAVTVIGGGDSAAAVEQAGLEERVTHVSTGGGASLEFLEGRTLPGVDALTDKS